MSDPIDTERPAGDPLVPRPEAPPAGEDAPQPAPEDTEPPHGDPLTEPESDDDDAARANEYLELAKRKQAEFENFRRRMNVKLAEAEDRGVAKLARELLPALDHLERALDAAETDETSGEWLKGIRLVQEELLGALGRVGIQPFAPVGEPFDPNEHEAMASQPAAEGEDAGTVAQVYQAGYRINGAVLRPARVVVTA